MSDTFTQNQFPNSSKIETLELYAGYLISKMYIRVVLEQNVYLLVARVNKATKISTKNKTELHPHTLVNQMWNVYKIRNKML